MKLIFHINLFTLLTLTYALTATAAPPVHAIIRMILAADTHTQTKLLLRYSNEQYAPHTPLNKEKRLERLNRLKDMAPTLICAIRHLHEIPGFSETLHITLQSLHIPSNGQFYEIQKALAIGQAYKSDLTHEMVLAMNSPIALSDQSQTIFFDVTTTKRLIECKAIRWNKTPSDRNPIASKLCTQFLRQQRAVASLNQEQKTSYAYEVHSKHPVPAIWLNWFKTHKISVIQEKN